MDVSLYAHMEEGIRDPIKVYEYLNWFYVVEGNKRVSVLKYCDAYSISAVVTRLIPKKMKMIQSLIFIMNFEFNKLTGINDIWFKENSFKELSRYIQDYIPNLKFTQTSINILGNVTAP